MHVERGNKNQRQAADVQFFLKFLLHNQRISGPQNPNSPKIALRTPPVARSCDQSSHENVWVHRLALAP